jgi:hypothetical protein
LLREQYGDRGFFGSQGQSGFEGEPAGDQPIAAAPKRFWIKLITIRWPEVESPNVFELV